MSQSTSEDAQNPSDDDFYMENGCVVFTAAYHRRRGYCCGSDCRHCPFEGADKRPAPLGPPADGQRARRGA